mgnify:CR=1 FL=1
MEKVIEELRVCAAAISRIADTLAEKDELEVAALTLEEVRKTLAELSQRGLIAEVKAIIKKHGADRLSDLAPVEYAAVLKEAESIGK